MSLRLPAAAARPSLAALVLVWVGVVSGRFGWWAVVVAGSGVLVAVRPWRKFWIVGVAALVAGCIAGVLSVEREQALMKAELPEGPNTALMVALTDGHPSPFGGVWFLARPFALEMPFVDGRRQWIDWIGPPLVVNVSTQEIEIAVGRHLAVTGRFRSSPGNLGGSTFAGRVAASRVETISGDLNPLLWAGNGVRNRVLSQLRGRGPAAALVSGFLVGHVDELPRADIDALRLAGVSHYVAVSGANVAGFLLLWFIVLGPLGVGSRRRGFFGLAAVAVFAIATRWEPSVVRASLMAGTVLAGRAMGVPVDSWTALGWSGTLALLVAPELAESLGFQLSVLATAGIMSGGNLLPVSFPGWLRGSLGSTLAAQGAVTPLLLAVFGSVPLVSPISNLVAAPLVSLITLIGGLGTLTGLDPLIVSAIGMAGWVLDLAHIAAGFPQIGALGVATVVAGVMAARSNRLRPYLAVIVAVTLVWGGLSNETVTPPALVFIDVGQGDASLILASDGTTILVDAGPDPPILAAALRRYRVNRINLLVVTHPHEDHIAGLVGLVGRVPIHEAWTWGRVHTGRSWELLSEQLLLYRVPVEAPAVGTSATFGDVVIEVLGPLRRYDGINDQSVVIMVSAGATKVLLTGDIEVAAQTDLGPIRADVLKVPHHGGPTSSFSWLTAVEPGVAVVSVGQNDYGHPAPEVMEVLDSLGAVVVRTDQAGDVVIPLTGDPLRLVPVAESGRFP